MFDRARAVGVAAGPVIRIPVAGGLFGTSLYLLAAFSSDALGILTSRWEPGVIETHLGGEFGAYLVAAGMELLGRTSALVPLIPLLLGLLLVHSTSRRAVVHAGAYLIAILFLLPVLLGAVSPWVDGHMGGRIGRWAADALSGPVGPAGAVLLPLTFLATASVLFFQRGRLLAAVGRGMLWGMDRLEGRRKFGARGSMGEPGLEEGSATRSTGGMRAPRFPLFQGGTRSLPVPAGPSLPDDRSPRLERPRAAPSVRQGLDDEGVGAPPPDGDVAGYARPHADSLPRATEPSTGPPNLLGSPGPAVHPTDTPSHPSPGGPLPDLPLSAGFPDRGHDAEDTSTNSPWDPPADLFLDSDDGPLTSMEQDREIGALGERLSTILAQYKVPGTLRGKTVGPRVISFHVELQGGQRVSRYEAVERELSLQLRQTSIRVTTIPSSGAVGIEVPNPASRTVSFREVYADPRFRKSGVLPLALGLDVEGLPVYQDLAKAPHLLLAGATGSGKSVALNAMLAGLTAHLPPEDLGLVLIDPKRVEMAPWADLPHLRNPVIYDADEVSGVLRWAVREMERRYEALRQAAVRKLSEYRGIQAEQGLEPIPYLVLLVDELGDLMMGEQRQPIETALVQLAQKARAVGIHLILATQRPTAEVVTGLLKANIPARASFRVPQALDSRVILDRSGAERLMGAGDMLFITSGTGEVRRIQAPFLDLPEIGNLVNWARMERPDFHAPELDLKSAPSVGDLAADLADPGAEDRPYLEAAIRVCAMEGKASTSLLQRRLRIGYGKAARLVDQMEALGWVSSAEGTNSREVLVAPSEATFGD